MRLISASWFAVTVLASAPMGYAQDQKAAGGAGQGDEIRAIHQLLEQQAHQLETLTQQVAKLSALIESAHAIPAATPPASAAQNMPPVQETNPGPASSPDAPRAEAVDIGTTHVVTRGETLTSIAKQYKVSVGELQKVNKIHNDRTLQIGQTLTIPAPKSSTKKESQ